MCCAQRMYPFGFATHTPFHLILMMEYNGNGSLVCHRVHPNIFSYPTSRKLPSHVMYSGVTPKLSPCAIPRIVPTLLPTLTPSRALGNFYLYIKFWAQNHCQVDNMCTNFQSQKIDNKKDIQYLLTRGSCKKCFTAANFDTIPRIEKFFFSHESFGVETNLCFLHK